MHASHSPDEGELPGVDELGTLRSLTPFSGLCPTRFEALARTAVALRLPARVALAVEGRRPDTLCTLLEGCIELHARANGREATTGIVRPGGLVPLSAVVRDLPCLVSARTCAASKLLLLPAVEVRSALDDDAGFARAIVAELVERHRAELRAHKEIKLRSATQRLAARLLRYEREQGGGGSLVLPCDKRTLASLLAMTPENLSRAFAALGAAGVVVAGPAITLGDRAALVALARPDPLIDGRADVTRGARYA